MLNNIILGLVQGLTEFLPVSSSAHLILARELLHLPLKGSIILDVFLHLATLLATIIFFWGDIRRIFIDLFTNGFSTRSRHLVAAIIAGSIPATIVGFTWGDKIETVFRNTHLVAYTLILGSLVFFIADKFAENNKDTSGISTIKGFIVGIFQSFALIPGLSRSGMSISGGLFSKLSREEAIKFSFLLSIPAIAGAALKTFFDAKEAGLTLSGFLGLDVIAGFVVAFVSGYFAISFLVRYLSTHSFTAFIIYRAILALLILGFL